MNPSSSARSNPHRHEFGFIFKCAAVRKNLRALIKDWLYRDITDGRRLSVVSYRIKQDHVRNSQPVWGHMQIDHVTRSISWPFESDQINCCCQCEQLNILRDKRTRWRGEFNIPAASSGLSVLHGRQFLASAENGSSGSLETRTWTGNGQKQAERASLMKLNVRTLQLFFIWNLLHILPTSLNSSPNCKLRAAAASVTVSLTHTVAPECTTGSPRCLIFTTSTWTTSADSFNINWSVCKPADSGCS